MPRRRLVKMVPFQHGLMSIRHQTKNDASSIWGRANMVSCQVDSVSNDIVSKRDRIKTASHQDDVVSTRRRVHAMSFQNDVEPTRCRIKMMLRQDDAVPRWHRANTPSCQGKTESNTTSCELDDVSRRRCVKTTSRQDDTVSRQHRVKTALSQDDIVLTRWRVDMAPS